MPSELDGRRALVTGGAGGIGLAIANRLAAAGARVAVTDVDEDGAVRAAEAIGNAAVGLRCDVCSTDEVNASTGQVVEAFGGLDILVNNAGIEISSPLVQMVEADVQKIFDVNVVGLWRSTVAATPALVESKGCIVNLASVAGLGGAPLLGAYCGTKGAVVRMTEVLALELRDAGVRVNCVCPAFVDTPMVDRLVAPFSAVAEGAGLTWDELVKVAQGRLGTVEEVAEVVAFLASDDAAWTTGSPYVLDGGMTGSLL